MEEENLLKTINFSFPYEPYSIQSDFMDKLYLTLEEKKFGIFESPTGTGKSLSIICAVLTWLQNYETRIKSELICNIDALEQQEIETSEDWLSQQSKQIGIKQKKQKLELELKQITSKEERINLLKERSKLKLEDTEELKKWKDLKIADNPSTDALDDEDLILDDNFNIEEEDKSDEENEIEKDEGIKIYFCSRTHSQLTQFINEIRKTSFHDIRVISLASRQNYCINDSVNKLKNITLINERCLDLQKNKKNKKTSKEGKVLKKSCSSGCIYNNQKNIERLTNKVILNVQDIEEIVKNGLKLSACPYYASRKGISDAQIIVVPYNTLLHKSTRKASGLKLKGNIVIIDEAHNLLESIGQMHSCEINGQQLIHAYSQIKQYRDRYQSRFSPSNLLSLNQLIFIIGKFIKILGGNVRNLSQELKTTSVDSKIYTISDFAHFAEIDNLNIYKLLIFAEKSKLSQKLNGFSYRYENNVNVETTKKSNENSIKAFLKEFNNDKSTSVANTMNENNKQEIISNNPILPILSFLETLTNICEDGRIILTKQITLAKSRIKFLLLNPASQFTEIVQQARSIIVAGGTMQPFDEFKQQLFLSAGTEPSKIVEFSCDHIIPPENILPIILCKGPSGKQFDFSYENRNTLSMMNELGRLLENIVRIVPAGVVCFFPSYDYEDKIFNQLNSSGTIDKIKNYKKVFREPKKGGCVDKILDDYAKAIHNKSNLNSNGAILFSVVGGKLSEGLNFSDDLGRCVILVGLPYANIKSPELLEKMNYLTINMGKEVANIYYENLCMKAVNQSIGRAVRHKNDYSSVLLIDHRFSRKKNSEALPKWILKSLKTYDKCGQAFGEICKFFSQKNNQN